MAVRDLCMRLGLRGIIMRYGEPWKTDEIKGLESDIRLFYQTYEPFKKADLPYPPEFKSDIDNILNRHGPTLWPDGPRDNEETCRWLFPARSIPEYPEDIYYPRDFLKIHPLFEALLTLRVTVYATNQRNHLKKLQARQETLQQGPPSESDLTEFDSAIETSDSRVIRMKFHETNQQKLQEILAHGEFGLRKRKANSHAGSSPSSAKRPRPLQETVVDQNSSAHTTADGPKETIRVANPSQYPHHDFVAINSPAQPRSGNDRQISRPNVSDTDDDVSVFGRAELSVHSSSDGVSSPSGGHRVPRTPGETETHGMQYSLPQDAPRKQSAHSDNSTQENGEQLQHGGQEKSSSGGDHPHAFPTQPIASSTLRSELSNSFIPYKATTTVSNRRAKKSKTSLRPLPSEGHADPDSQPRGSQSHKESQQITVGDSLKDLLLLQSPTSHITERTVSISPAINGTPARKLVRRTHWNTVAEGKSASQVTDTDTPADKPTNSEQQRFAPLSSQPVHQKSVENSAPATEAVIGALDSRNTSTDHQTSHPHQIADNQTLTSPIEMSISEQLITKHLANTFVKFSVKTDANSRFKMVKLGDCCDVYKLYETVMSRFEPVIKGQTPTEILFTINGDGYDIEGNEGGQVLWDELMQILVDTAPDGTRHIMAEIKI